MKNCLRNKNKDLHGFSPDLIWKEMCQSVPHLISVLKAASSSIRDCCKSSDSMSQDQRNYLIMCVAIFNLMKHRSTRTMNYLQTLIGLSLYDGHATKRVN